MSLVWEVKFGDYEMQFDGDSVTMREDGYTVNLTADQIIMLDDYLTKYRKLQEMADD